MVSTICRLPSSGIIPVFREYGDRSYYVSISDADRNPSLNYISTVYHEHSNRNEHWSVISGSALVTIDGKDTLLEAGQAIDIPREAAHRVSNPGQPSLVFIEIQRGSYLG